MKRLVLLFGALLLSQCAWAQCSNTTIAAGIVCVQGIHWGSSPSSGSFASNLGAHHLIIITAGANDTGSTGWAPTGTNNTYASAVLTAGGPSTHRELQIFYTCDSVAGAETVTFSPNTAPAYADYYGFEISGIATSNCLDATKAGSFGTSGTTGTFTVTSGDLIIANALSGGGSASAGGGYTQRVSGDTFFLEEDAVASGASVSATLSGSLDSDSVIEAAAFKASGGSSNAFGFNKRRKLEASEQ